MAATETSSMAAETPRKFVVRPARPNYNFLHKDPLPLRIEPLPPLVPHNPISLMVIAWVYVRSLLNPAKQPVYKGYFSTETRAVHVVDKTAVRALWESGFFGKGALSRSEPTWLNREKQRRGIIAGETSEDITRRRRQERAEFKKERARKEREEIEATLKREQANGVGNGHSHGAQTFDSMPATPLSNGHLGEMEYQKNVDASLVPMTTMHETLGTQRRHQADASHSHTLESNSFHADEDVLDLEHLQLSLEEAFFLHFALGVLDVYPQTGSQQHSTEASLTRDDLFTLFQSSSVYSVLPSADLPAIGDNSFLANYAVYHHFRSLGWIVRPGTKFAVDWMLYNRGPVFSHAEFAVLTMPSFTAWKGHVDQTAKTRKPWHWLHMVNRVQSQVRKTLVLAFVEMPPPDIINSTESKDPVTVLSAMRVREIVLKRWIPNRNRD